MAEMTPEEQVRRLVEEYGYDLVVNLARDAQVGGEKVLTLVSNQGLHAPPAEFMLGEVYYVTKGPLKFRSVDEVNAALDESMRRLKDKLLETRWSKIYLIPFGPVVFNMHIKMTVFRTLWIDTIDIFYFGNNEYGALVRDSRQSLVGDDG